MNDYYIKIKKLKEKLITLILNIFKENNDEISLVISGCNLLENENNAIASSTAIGFILEEYIVSKLIYETENFEFKVERNLINKTINSSYDCFINYKDINFLINFKVEKNKKSNNNGVAAINILHEDYCLTNPEILKSYLVIKIVYDLGLSKIDNQRKIIIKGVKGYALEEIDFSKGYMQDHRNWSEKFNFHSGRLLISDNWYKKIY